LSYAVVWREDGGQLRVGKLELGPAGVSVQGSSPDGTIARRTVSYTDVADVRIARGAAEQINGRPAVVVRQPGGRELSIGALEGPGVVVELGYALAELVSERGEGRACAAVVLPIRPRAAERIRRLIAEGPPFDPAAFGLDRHRVYLTEREAIFFFEGPDVARTAGQLAAIPSVWQAAAAWAGCLSGQPRVAVEEYAWIGRQISRRATTRGGS
jgi:hypothetical protein